MNQHPKKETDFFSFMDASKCNLASQSKNNNVLIWKIINIKIHGSSLFSSVLFI